MKSHIIYDDEDDSKVLAYIHPASEQSVEYVLSGSTKTLDGRSDWVWIRLPNGDLILGVFPQGDTYFGVEEDAQYPE